MSAPAQGEHWLRVVANLRVDRKKGNIAPHKPLLLLVLAELAEQGNLHEPFLRLTGEIVFRFLAFWAVVVERRTQRPDIILPFYHLHSDGCWEALDETGTPTLERRRAVAAKLDEGFFTRLNDPHFREQMRRVLIARYFEDGGERAALYALVGLPVPPDDVVRADARLFEVARERGREARFRLTVVPAYNYTCAHRLSVDHSAIGKHCGCRAYSRVLRQPEQPSPERHCALQERPLAIRSGALVVDQRLQGHRCGWLVR